MDNRDLSLTQKQTYWASWRGVDLGYFTPDSLEITEEIMTSTLEVDQIETEAARVEYDGIIPAANMTLAQDSIQLIYQTLLTDLVYFKAGTEGPLYGVGDIGENAELHAGELVIIPTKNASGSRLNSYLIWKAYLPAQTISQLKGKGRFGELAVTFNALANKDMPAKARYMVHGNLDAEGNAPQGIAITLSRASRPEPLVSVPEVAIAAGTYDYLNAWLFYASNSTVTAAVNDIGNIDAVQKNITYDTLAGGAIVSGDIIKIDNEYMYVVSLTTTILTVVRAYGGSTAATHNDDTVITKQQNVYFWPGTRLVSWNSATPAKLTIGDVNGASDATEKARLTNVSADDGTSVITCSFQAVTSPNLTAKAAA